MVEVAFISDQVISSASDLYENPEFVQKCDMLFVQIAQCVRNGFADRLGFYQSSIWLKNTLKSKIRKNFASYISYAILSKAIPEEKSSEEDFVVTFQKNISELLNDYSKVAIDVFMEQVSKFLPKWLYENNLLKYFLYGNFSVSTV